MKIRYTALPLLLLSAPANASDFYFKPYLGANYQYTHLSYQNDPDTGLNGSEIASESLNGLDLHAGARVHRYLGFEGSYMWNSSPSKKNILGSGINSKVNLRGATLDAMGYLPIDEAARFELIATAGVSRLRGGVKFTGALVENDNDSETKGRIGAGAQYWLTNNINIRGIVRYQGADFSDSLNDAVITSIGFNYQF